MYGLITGGGFTNGFDQFRIFQALKSLKVQRSSMVEGYPAGLTGYVSARRKIPYVFFLVVCDFNS